MEIARAVAVGGELEPGEFLRTQALGFHPHDTTAQMQQAREWLAKRDRRPPGFDPKLVEPPKPAKSNPAHYQRDGIEPIDVIEAWDLDFRLANAIKYIARAGKKPGESRDADLEKAAAYLHRARFGRWPWQEGES